MKPMHDKSEGERSTFSDLVQALGASGATFDVRESDINLLDMPDLDLPQAKD